MNIDVEEFSADMDACISEQNKLLESRSETLNHTAYIKTSIAFKSDDNEFVDLLKTVFSHHDTMNFSFITWPDVDILSQDNVSRYFHHHEDYYLAPEIVQGLIPDNPTLTYEDFYKRLIETQSGEKNNLSFLIGGVGIGKTTFVCNFVSRSIAKLNAQNIVPVKINVDVSSSHTIPSRREILNLVRQGLFASLKGNSILNAVELERLAIDSRIPDDADETSFDANLLHITQLLKTRHGKQIFLIIDNIDYLYHLGDRGFFAPGGDNHPERANIRDAHQTIMEIINLFWRAQDVMSSHLGIPILVCCRQDTISFLMSKHHEVPLVGLEDRIFSLTPPSLEQATEVIERRFSLLNQLSHKVNLAAKRKEFLTHSERLSNLYSQRRRPGAALLDDLWKLSRKGLRDMINQISEFSWLEFLDGQKSVLNARFTQQYYPSMLAYMLAGKRRYTQFSGNVPNIYLINAPSPSNEVGVPESFKEPHLYSLWLKRLILEYLIKRRNFNTNEDDIINVFCGKNRRGYSENLVRYVLSSLFEVPTSELIDVDVGAEGSAGAFGYIKQINITKRGDFIARECSNSFKYLQLAVDDWKLLLPTKLHSLFAYVEPDYSYLVRQEREYGEALDGILQRKGKQTFLFAILIEECLLCEQQIWPKVFERLERQGVLPLEAEDVTLRVKSEITAIVDALSLDVSVDYFDDAAERRARAVIKDALEEVYNPCRELRQKHYGRT